MATVAAVRHVAFEDLGILETLFAKRGDTVVYFDAPVANFTDSALQEADLLVVLGAPIGAFDDALYPFLSAEAECIRRRVASDKAVLGICLGAQLIARVLGAQVNPMGVKEIGFKPLELTNEGKQSPLRHLAGVPVLHWHGDCFGLPQGATSLAYTNVSHERGFSLGGKLLSLELSMESEIYCE
ncbi:GMP synthase (glutamine-hydrolyzing) [Neisseria perflava]|nr:glutamine amidotransferase [Neisseria perflava]MCP1772230.1 GMP synthase (glutamine-hydrolyzing) [Neisseria perflava]